MESSEIQLLTTKFIELITGSSITNSSKDIRITKSIEYLQNNLDKTIKLSEVANFVFLSESRFAHLFK